MAIVRFGINGWQSRISQGFNANVVAQIAAALGELWSIKGEGSRVFVGFDARRDSRRFATIVGQVLAAYGLEAVVSEDICPSPALRWSVARDPLCIGGVMLTALSLPCEYGGIVACQGDGAPLSVRETSIIDQRIGAAPSNVRGEVQHADFVQAYIDSMVFNSDTSLIESSDLKIVLDTMHGAGCGYARELFERMGCKVLAIHDKPIPDFRGLHPVAHEPWVDECERVVVSSHADMGIVLDGACERFALIDEKGRLVSQHDLAPMILEHIVRQRGKHGRVVGTVATSARISREADLLGCEYTMVPVGIDSIYRELGEGDVILAADETGGITVPSHIPMRDGIIGAVMLLEYAAAMPSTVSKLVDDMTEQIGRLEYASRDVRLDAAAAQRLRNVLPGLSPELAFGLLPSPVVRVSHVDGLRADLEDGSWLLLRPSRGGPTARAYAEAPAPAQSRSLAAQAASASRG